MKITFHGASGGEVTGSCYHIETNRAKILLDCGMFQGGHRTEDLNRLPPGAEKVDAVVLTHGHLDHTGRLPLLARAGYRGHIHATPATIEPAIAEPAVAEHTGFDSETYETIARRR